MRLAEFTDSVASTELAPGECPFCQSAVRIGVGKCLSCLLRTAIEPGESADAEGFTALLNEVEVQDEPAR